MKRLVTAMLLCSLATLAQCKEPHVFSDIDRLTTNNTYPLFPMAIPLSGGPIKTLFIAPYSTLSDTVELAARIQLDFDVAPLSSSESDDQRLRELLANEYDLIVAANFESSPLPEDIVSAIVEKVRQGAGLVLFQYDKNPSPQFDEFTTEQQPADGAAYLTNGLGASLTPEWQNGTEGIVNTSLIGKGKVVRLTFKGKAPESHFALPPIVRTTEAKPTFFENYYSLAARALRWAARGAPKISISKIEQMGAPRPDEDEVPPFIMTDHLQYMVEAAHRSVLVPHIIYLNTPAGKDYFVRFQIRTPGMGKSPAYLIRKRPFKKGATSYHVPIPVGPGKHFLDIWLLDKKLRTEEWHTKVLDIEGWPEVSDLKFSKYLINANDTVEISMNVRGLFYEPKECTVVAMATDPFGRLVADARIRVPAEGGKVWMRLFFADLISRFVKVDVYALDRNGWGGGASDYLYVRPLQKHSDLSFVALGTASAENNSRKFNITLNRLGVDTLYVAGGVEAGEHTAKANLRALPRILEKTTAGMDKSCLFCSVAPEKDETLDEAVEEFWGGGSRLYAMGFACNQNFTTEKLCTNELCQSKFAEYLKEQYASLDALNATWHSRFISWDDITPATKEQVQATQNYAPWIDLCRYLDSARAKLYCDIRETISSKDSQARIGDVFAASPNFWPILSELEFIAADSSGIHLEKLRSLKTEETMAGIIFGKPTDTPTVNHAKWWPWHQVLHGMNSVWYSLPDQSAGNQIFTHGVGPDGLPSPIFAETARQVTELKSGIATLLSRAQRDNSGIAVLHSTPSERINEILNAKETTNFPLDADSLFTQQLEELGYQYDFVSGKQIESGVLQNYRLLILPSISAASDKQIREIRSFVSAGGCMIANVIPAAFYQNGSKRKTSPLADLFGVSDTTGKKILIQNDADQLETFLRTNEFATMVDLKTKSGKPFEGERIAYRLGDAQILALVRRPGAEREFEKLSFKPSRRTYVYDIKQGEQIKRPKEIELKLGRGETAVYASLPYEVTGISLLSPESLRAGERLNISLKVKTIGGLPGEHVVRIELSPRDSAPIQHYSQNVICPNGTGYTYIPLELNRPPGKYTLTARDVLTGTTVEKTIVVLNRSSL